MKFDNYKNIIASEDLFSDDAQEHVTLDLQLVKEKIPTHSSIKLCDMIVCDRYFGFNKEINIMCMEELSKRRINGDNFEYEIYIENAIKELPPLDFTSGFDIREVLNQAIRKK